MEQHSEIGQRIQAARRERGLTQDALAAAVGVSRSAVAQWETGRSGQLTTHLAAIARALGVGVEFLMQGSDSVRPPCRRPMDRSSRFCGSIANARRRTGRSC